jgi:hypothetical protein
MALKSSTVFLLGSVLSTALMCLAVTEMGPQTCRDTVDQTCPVDGEPTEVTANSNTMGAFFMQLNKRGAVLKVTADCCSNCASSPFCSPRSGSCYDQKSKDYYIACTTTVYPFPGCCSSCSGVPFCSPLSGNCHPAKTKDYYLSCPSSPSSAPVPAPAPAPTPTPSPQGGLAPPPSNAPPPAPIPGGALGALVWADEFNVDGGVDRSKWAYQNGPNPSNQERQYYTDRADNSFVQNGALQIIAKCESYASYSYTSARLRTKGLASWGPGHRVEARIKLPVGRGTWPAFWMLPTNNAYGGWPNSGEIDILETVGCTQGKVYGTVHTGAYNHMKGTQKGSSTPTDYSQWHTYTVDWSSGGVKWYLDGKEYYSYAPDNFNDSSKWPFNQQFYIILNVAVGGSWGGFCFNGGRPSCSSNSDFGSPQVMQVDYVRVYKLN